MTARLSVEELHPARARPVARDRQVRRAFQGARVRAEGSPLEPRDAGGILDLALEGLLARLGPCLALALVFWLPFRQVAELLGLSGLDGLEAELSMLAWNALEVVPLGATAAVVASLVGDALVDRRARVAPGILRGLARAPGAIVVLLLTQFATLPLALLCGAPYFLALWLTWAAVPIYVLEGESLLTDAERARARRSMFAWLVSQPRRVMRAIGRSIRLSAGAPALGRWVLLAVVGQLVFGGVLEIAAIAVTDPRAREYLRTELGFGGTAVELSLGAVAALFASLSACVRGALALAFYLDLRVRREAWDLDLQLERAPAPAPATMSAMMAPAESR